MSANQEAMRATIATAEAVKVAAVQSAQTAFQGTIAASSTNVGYWCGKGGSGESTYQAAVVTANNALRDARVAAERAKQGTVTTAKDLLRSQGEIG